MFVQCLWFFSGLVHMRPRGPVVASGFLSLGSVHSPTNAWRFVTFHFGFFSKEVAVETNVT